MNPELQALQQNLNITLQPQPDPGLLKRHHTQNSYALDDKGQLIGLNLCKGEWTDEQLAAIWQFSYLQVLNLHGNRLSAVSIPKIMAALRWLDVSDNEPLSALSFEDALPSLEHLDASDCQVQRLELPSGFPQLKWLDVARNKMGEVVFLGKLPQLEYLDLSNNQLTRFELPEKCPSLTYLYLFKNQLSTFELVDSLSQLEILHLADNNLRKFSTAYLDWLPQQAVLYLSGNPLPMSIRGFINEGYAQTDCRPALEDFKKELAKGETINNEYKTLLVGNGKVGKTCLALRLLKNEFSEEWDSTHGITVEQLKKKNLLPYVLNIWDFGGQDIYHATHRLFFQAEALYLLLWDWETEKGDPTPREEHGQVVEYENYPLSYWLEYIESHGKESQAIVVRTKKIEHGPHEHPDKQELLERFGELIVDFQEVDSKEKNWVKNGFRHLLISIEEAIQKMEREESLPDPWVKARQQLRKMCKEENRPTLPVSEYLELAQKLDINEPVSPISLLKNWLVKTGVVFYREGLFNNEIILDQEWAIKGIYTLFRREVPKEEDDTGHLAYRYWLTTKGRFTGEDLATVWSAQKYTEEEQQYFLDFMLSCEICFEITPEENRWKIPFIERRFIAPQLLPIEKPPVVKKQEQYWRESKAPSTLWVRYRHTFLHYGVIQSFIYQTHLHAEVEGIWRNGILIKDSDVSGLIEIHNKKDAGGWHYDELSVRVPREGKPLLDKALNLLEELQQGPYEQWVSVNGEKWVDANKLNKNTNEKYIEAEDGTSQLREDFNIFLHRDSKAVFPRQYPVPENLRVAFSSEEVRLLFVAANPLKGKYTINWQAAQNYIEQALSGSEYRERYQLIPRPQASYTEMIRALEDENPHILHFCGHGQEEKRNESGAVSQKGSLVFHNDEKNDAELLDVAIFEQTLKFAKRHFPNLKVIVLNACFSRKHAHAASRLGYYALGMEEEVLGEGAQAFAAGFYRHLLAEPGDVRGAVDHGISEALLKEEDIAQLVRLYHNGEQLFPEKRMDQ